MIHFFKMSSICVKDRAVCLSTFFAVFSPLKNASSDSLTPQGNAQQKGCRAKNIIKKEKPLQNLKRLSSFNIW